LKTNVVVPAERWKAALPAMYIWIDQCSIPQPSAGKVCSHGVLYIGVQNATHATPMLSHAAPNAPSFSLRDPKPLIFVPLSRPYYTI
jgi:hypothetical protein